ncbi:hypothetical protein HAP47_0036380 [Bradyrhizobium sp. 41S5]|uniref:hypothetical protein n=1 Tax=Bradyrhizobium sp. 41S5 TaxID=1404443 RepID=UPI00156AD3B9|nr:hypothetical protein [Bradyrhizobium sp. 41S5]UFX44425.1 hypothetical protein HAP47_0036380 [Bradyrhizobium sp. 41S5]
MKSSFVHRVLKAITSCTWSRLFRSLSSSSLSVSWRAANDRAAGTLIAEAQRLTALKREQIELVVAETARSSEAIDLAAIDHMHDNPVTDDDCEVIAFDHHRLAQRLPLRIPNLEAVILPAGSPRASTRSSAPGSRSPSSPRSAARWARRFKASRRTSGGDGEQRDHSTDGDRVH